MTRQAMDPIFLIQNAARHFCIDPLKFSPRQFNLLRHKELSRWKPSPRPKKDTQPLAGHWIVSVESHPRQVDFWGPLKKKPQALIPLSNIHLTWLFDFLRKAMESHRKPRPGGGGQNAAS